MRILVTGGAGFLGSYLCEKLLNENHIIYCLDNLYTGSMNNIERFMNNQNFNFINHNIIEPIDIEVDLIYNLACPASPPHYQKDPIFTLKTNIHGIFNMLELAKKYNARLLQASTSEIYGEPKVHPQTESYRGNVNPIGIRACYDEGKRVAETICFDYNRKYGVDIRIVRIFNTYGPYMSADDGRVVSNFITQALNNEDITIYGDGSQTRSFCYVDDLIDGFVKMMDSDFTGPINLGNPVEFTIKELAEKIIKLTDSKSKIIYRPLPSDDPTQRKPVIDLAKEKLDWQPRVMIDEGLVKTIDYFNDHNGGKYENWNNDIIS